MFLTENELKVQEEANEYARKNKASIAKNLTSMEQYPPEMFPVSVFMAGSPGAGKTEASIELIEKFTSPEYRVLRIDPDELRSEFPAYSGGNSYLFQGAV